MKKIALGIQPQLKQVEVVIDSGLLMSSSIALELKKLGRRFALLCDENVADLLGGKWQAHLQTLGLDVVLFSFPAGEKEKCRERKAALEDQLFAQKFGKDTCMIAMGGGVTTDLIGFLASTYCRGVSLVYVPTTLLGIVDAAIGGKTGINTRFGKNLVGAFYTADQILIDPSTLVSLPASEWVSGAAEVIKYALIRSPQLFESLKEWKPHEKGYIEKIIHESILIKAEVVEIDFEEKLGLRRILNFGHTIAHAIELLEEYQIAHGEAVAIGMLVESYLSVKMGYLSTADFIAIEKLIRSFPFALSLSPRVTVEKMWEVLLLDKKSAEGMARFVLLESIGGCCSFNEEYCIALPEKIVEGAIEWMLNQFSGGS